MVWAVVPVKKLQEVKQRIAGYLTPQERCSLYLAMLSDVLHTLKHSECIQGIAVITPDRELENIVTFRNKKMIVLRERDKPSLNGAIRQAACYCKELGCESILVLPGDLPFIHPPDVNELVRRAEESEVTIVPDRHRQGTNALLIKPPIAIEPHFGQGSFLAHIREAEALNRSYKIVDTISSFRWDIDLPEDLSSIADYGKGTATQREFYLLGLDKRVRSLQTNSPKAGLPVRNRCEIFKTQGV